MPRDDYRNHLARPGILVIFNNVTRPGCGIGIIGIGQGLRLLLLILGKPSH